ncbi:hypothetical protein KBA01_28610 [Kozakia baliensis]|nr:hypothetical protein KBA01_28610 [Kozakia baliensis]
MLPNGLQTLGGDGLPSTAHFRTSPTDRGGGSNYAHRSIELKSYTKYFFHNREYYYDNEPECFPKNNLE